MTRRLRIRLTLLVAFGLLQAASNAGAQSIYSCRDRYGHTLTSDRPIADCVGVMRELAPSGVVKREIAPPLTPEQQRQKEADDRAKRTAEEAAREQHRRDMALLAVYQNEDQIEAARKRSLSDANESIKASHERLADLEKERKGLEQDAEAFKGKTVPPLFKRKVDDNQALIDDEQAAIKQRQVDVERVNQRYDEDKRRFRELSATKK
jgi:Domain of unknown function (DUF4124)